MPRSETVPPTRARPWADWRAWVALAWVGWFALLYGRMVIAQRGGMLRGAAATVSRPAGPR